MLFGLRVGGRVIVDRGLRCHACDRTRELGGIRRVDQDWLTYNLWVKSKSAMTLKLCRSCRELILISRLEEMLEGNRWLELGLRWMIKWRYKRLSPWSAATPSFMSATLRREWTINWGSVRGKQVKVALFTAGPTYSYSRVAAAPP